MAPTSQLVRGHCILYTADFIEARRGSDPESPRWRELKAVLPSIKGTDWYPRRLHAELLGALGESKGERSLLSELVRCGEHVAAKTSDNFLRAALKIMTPQLLAKTLAQIWALNHRGGSAFEADAREASQGRLRLESSLRASRGIPTSRSPTSAG